MNKSTLTAIAVGLALAAVLVGVVLVFTSGNRPEVRGEVSKVRYKNVDAQSTFAVIDFRVFNESRSQVLVKEVTVLLDFETGQPIKGEIMADIDATRTLEYYKDLGPKYNQSLKFREKIDPGQSMDRMLAVRFEASDAQMRSRAGVRILIDDSDGQQSEIDERRPQKRKP